jgi:hypothetical protein
MENGGGERAACDASPHRIEYVVMRALANEVIRYGADAYPELT